MKSNSYPSQAGMQKKSPLAITKNFQPMKQILTILCALAFVATLSAQNDVRQPREIQTFHSGPMSHGFSVGLNGHYGRIEGEDALFFGMSLNYVMNHFLEVGLAGKWFYTEKDEPAFSDQDIVLTGGYGGLHISPSLFYTERVHVSFPLILGAGAVGYYDEELADIFDHDYDAEDWDVMFVAEPGVNVVFNIARFFKMETGISYRITNEVKLDDLPEYRMDGISLGIGFKFGIL
jgi:hypothetical protein